MYITLAVIQIKTFERAEQSRQITQCNFQGLTVSEIFLPIDKSS